MDAHSKGSEKGCSCRHPDHSGLRAWLSEDSVSPQLPGSVLMGACDSFSSLKGNSAGLYILLVFSKTGLLSAH